MSLNAVRQSEGHRVGRGPATILESLQSSEGLGKSEALARAESSITSTQSISAASHIDSTIQLVIQHLTITMLAATELMASQLPGLPVFA